MNQMEKDEEIYAHLLMNMPWLENDNLKEAMIFSFRMVVAMVTRVF